MTFHIHIIFLKFMFREKLTKNKGVKKYRKFGFRSKGMVTERWANEYWVYRIYDHYISKNRSRMPPNTSVYEFGLSANTIIARPN